MFNSSVYHKYIPSLAKKINDNLPSTQTQKSDITTALQGYHKIYQINNEDKKNALEVNLQLARIMQNRSDLFAPFSKNDAEIQRIQNTVMEYLQNQYRSTFNNSEIVIDWDNHKVLGANMNGRFISTKDLSKIALLDFTNTTFQENTGVQKITEKISSTIDKLLEETNNAINTLKPALSLTDISTIMGTDSGEEALKQIQSLLKNLQSSFAKTQGDMNNAADIIKEALYEKVEDTTSAIQRYKPKTSKLHTLNDNELYNAINKGVLSIANTPYDNKSPYVLVRETLNLINRMISGITAVQQLQGDLLETMIAAISQAAIVGVDTLTKEMIKTNIKGDKTFTIQVNDKLFTNATAQVSKKYGDAFLATFNQSNSRNKIDVESKLGSGATASISVKNYSVTKYVSDLETKQNIKRLAKVHVVTDTNLFVLLQFINQSMLHDFVTLSQISDDTNLKKYGEDFARSTDTTIASKRKNIRQNIFDLIIAGAVSGARQKTEDIISGTGDFARLFVINDSTTGQFICLPTNQVIRKALQMELQHTKGATHAASIEVGSNSKSWYGGDDGAAPILKTSPSANRLFTDPASILTALREVKIAASLGGQVFFNN